MRHAALLISIGFAVACAESPPAPECLADTPSAATVAEPAAPEPDLPLKDYFAPLRAAVLLDRPEWAGAMDQLAVHGDAFALQFLKTLPREKLAPKQQEQLDAAV